MDSPPPPSASAPPPHVRTQSPLTLPALHLGSFSDLKLGEQFGLAAPGERAEEDGEETEDRAEIDTPPANPLPTGIPYLRESTINRRRTMIVNDETSLPRSIRHPDSEGSRTTNGFPTPVTTTFRNHPDYDGFPYFPPPQHTYDASDTPQPSSAQGMSRIEGAQGRLRERMEGSYSGGTLAALDSGVAMYPNQAKDERAQPTTSVKKPQQHHQSRSMGASTAVLRPRELVGNDAMHASTNGVTGRPRTLHDLPIPFTRSSDPLSAVATATSTPYQQTSYNPLTSSPTSTGGVVPTIPGLLASVRGGTGEAAAGGPYPVDAMPRAQLGEWTLQEQQQRERDEDGNEAAPAAAAAAAAAGGKGADGDGNTGQPSATTGRGDIVPLRVKIPPPQEEICMECLMRDRDLIHVAVTPPRVWARASDADLRDLLSREREFDDHWEAEHGWLAYEGDDPVPARLRARERWTSSVEEGDLRTREERNVRLLRDVDERLASVVRWRGFSWEEQGGDGLPIAFRGRFGGELVESKLKELATKMIAPSAHRYKTLQKYLADQALLVGVPPEEEPELESNVWLREHERVGSTSSHRRMHEQRGELLEMRRGSSQGREFGYGDRTTSPGRYNPDRGVAARATMYDGSVFSQQSRYVAVPAGHLQQSSDVVPPSIRVNPRVPAIHLDVRKGRGISSPGLLELSSQPPSASRVNSRPSPTAGSFRQDQMYNFTDDDGDDDEVASAGNNAPPLRPFSFAFGEGREGLSSVLGRWGGSVTSLFGGSQAGGSHWGSSHGGNSGSMMDMHLGLDLDRRRVTALNAHPRAISMASLSRPPYFARATSSYMSHQEPMGDTGSMLTPVDTRVSEMPYEQPQRAPRYSEAPAPPVAQGEKKKKGFKGLLQKIGGNKKQKSAAREAPVSRSGSTGPPSRDEDYSTPLAPPPPISFLVQRSDRAANHTRTSSSSSLSAFSGSSSPPMPSSASMMMRMPGRNSNADAALQPPSAHQNQRSVSAPLVQSPSRGSLLDGSSGNGGSRIAYTRDPPSAPSQYGSTVNTRSGQNYSRPDSYASASSRRGTSIPGLQHAYNGSQGMEFLENENVGGQSRAVDNTAQDEVNASNSTWASLPPNRSQQGYRGPPSLSSSSGTLLPLSVESPGLGTQAPNVRVASSGPGTPVGERSALSWQSPVLANQTIPPSATGYQKSLPPLPSHGSGNLGPVPYSRQEYRARADSPDSVNAYPNQDSWSERHVFTPGKQHLHIRRHSTLSSVSGRPSSDVPMTEVDKPAKKTKSKFGLKSLFSAGLNGKDTSVKRGEDASIERRQHDRAANQQPAYYPPGPLRYAPEALGRTQSADAFATTSNFAAGRFGHGPEHASPSGDGYGDDYGFERSGGGHGAYGTGDNTYPSGFPNQRMNATLPLGSHQPRPNYDQRSRQTYYQ
ncbi:hypothetical protein QFC19_004091 [Naganishia cerealis]|uniref:Uncharacterized protein n=1 Tax=Naganishia cerealis TaxID=610337 RepID=A0ACC2VXN9_9TREE|nr:hypothetical protein QFC19_004091 [Naganishia cerealis]